MLLLLVLLLHMAGALMGQLGEVLVWALMGRGLLLLLKVSMEKCPGLLLKAAFSRSPPSMITPKP